MSDMKQEPKLNLVVAIMKPRCYLADELAMYRLAMIDALLPKYPDAYIMVNFIETFTEPQVEAYLEDEYQFIPDHIQTELREILQQADADF